MKTITVRMPVEMHAQLHAAARLAGCSAEEYVRRALAKTTLWKPESRREEIPPYKGEQKS